MFGVHIDSSYDTLIKEAELAHKMKANIIQLFVDPFSKKKENYYLLKKYLIANKMKCVVHASYTINIAKNWDTYSTHLTQLIQEIELANIIGAIGIVVHLGKQLNLNESEALNNMYSSLIYVHNKTKKMQNIKIFIETSCGQGTELCYEIDKFAHFFRKFSNNNEHIKDRFRICLDTCHIFVAGHDLRTTNKIILFLNKIEKLIGIRFVGLIHLNDSKNELSSHIDRHESLGKGYIGKTGLKFFANFFKKINVPIVLETPSEKHSKEIKNFK